MILTPLMLHQAKALDYLKDHNPCALFMKYGTGKSLVALAYAEHIKAKLVLITSDKTNVLSTWVDQIETHTDFNYIIRPRLYRGKTCNFLYEQGVWCVLVNYEMLASVWQEYNDLLRFDLWIGDESSEFKDSRTLKHKHLAHIVEKIPHRIILNGEPMTERLEDMHGQFKVLDGGRALGSSITKFHQRYMMLDAQGYRWVPKRSAMTHVQRAVKDISYWLTDSTGIVMPTRRYHVMTVPMTKQQAMLDEDLKTKFAASLQEKHIEVSYAAALFLKRIQLMGGIFRPSDEGGTPIPVATDKLAVLRELFLRNQGSKIVVWHEYVPETALLRAKFSDHMPYVFDSPDCISVLDRFAKVKAGVLLIRTSFCKGLNQLADGDIAVFWSNPLSYRDRSQAIGRTCRMSSKNRETHVVDIVTKGGADEVVYQQLSQKKTLSLTLGQLRSIVQHN
jgi:hypothetical protein